MSEEIFVNLPKLGESIQSATVVQWFKKEGDSVLLDEPLLEVSTDKVNSEIPSPTSGILKKILAKPDEELDVGRPLCVLVAAHGMAMEKSVSSSNPTLDRQTEDRRDLFSPALLRLAKEGGIALDELNRVQGTGDGGRITKKDIETLIEKKKGCPASNRTERIPMSSMRKAIAENMKKSFYQAPHATLINEVDVTSILKKIEMEKEAFFEKHKAKLTITTFIARAIGAALKEYPLLNASLEEDTIVVKKYVNLGIAVSIEGGLLVPVIPNSEVLNLEQMAKALADISQRAREGKLNAQEVKEGTITLTNFGMAGVSIGVPIIRYPEVAIIGIGSIQKRALVLEDGSIAPRSIIHVSLTFDHRVIDGMYGCGFLASLQKHLEANP